MSFREKSAWGFLVLLTLAGAFYAWEVIGAGVGLGNVPPPLLKLAIVYVGFVVIGAVISQGGIAAFSGDEADQPADEREQIIIAKAGNGSGILLGVGLEDVFGWEG